MESMVGSMVVGVGPVVVELGPVVELDVAVVEAVAVAEVALPVDPPPSSSSTTSPLSPPGTGSESSQAPTARAAEANNKPSGIRIPPTVDYRYVS